MGRNQAKTCNVCFKTMRGDHLKRNKKKHEGGNEDNIVTNGEGTILGNVKGVNYGKHDVTRIIMLSFLNLNNICSCAVDII